MDPTGMEKLPRHLKKFYRGEPLALGITQILIGSIGIAFGVILNIADRGFRFSYVSLMTPFWTGVLYIISGSLSVAAAKNPKMPLVKSMLGMNVVSAVAAGVGIVILSFSLETPSHYVIYYICGYYHSRTTMDPNCVQAELIYYKHVEGIQAVLLAFTFLEFCISISQAAFGCKNVCRESYTETVVVLYQNPTPDNIVGPQSPSKDPESP